MKKDCQKYRNNQCHITTLSFRCHTYENDVSPSRCFWLVFLIQSTNSLQDEEHDRTDHEHPVDNTSWHSQVIVALKGSNLQGHWELPVYYQGDSIEGQDQGLLLILLTLGSLERTRCLKTSSFSTHPIARPTS